jgi:predicted aldo/keto reductase-like oxidoreductase
MSTMQQVEENVVTASRATYLSETERANVARAMEENKKLAQLYCTGCRYCLPCPQDVNIPRIFELVNYFRVYGLQDHAREAYRELLAHTQRGGKGKDATACAACEECESKCPQKLKIAEELKAAHALLAP